MANKHYLSASLTGNNKRHVLIHQPSDINHDILLLYVAFKTLRIADDTQTDQGHCAHAQVQAVTEKFVRLQLYTQRAGACSNKRQWEA